jgi:hypothetical protein
MKMFLAVTLAKAGVQSIKLDSGFRRNDQTSNFSWLDQ